MQSYAQSYTMKVPYHDTITVKSVITVGNDCGTVIYYIIIFSQTQIYSTHT